MFLYWLYTWTCEKFSTHPDSSCYIKKIHKIMSNLSNSHAKDVFNLDTALLKRHLSTLAEPFTKTKLKQKDSLITGKQLWLAPFSGQVQITWLQNYRLKSLRKGCSTTINDTLATNVLWRLCFITELTDYLDKVAHCRDTSCLTLNVKKTVSVCFLTGKLNDTS